MDGQDKIGDETKRAWDYYKHADSLHSGRINFFLVAETILLLIFFSEMSFISSESIKGVTRVLVGLSGVAYTFSWFYVNYGLSLRMKRLTNEYLKSDEVYRKYLEAANGLSSNTFLTWILPIVTLILWLLLMAAVFVPGLCPP